MNEEITKNLLLDHICENCDFYRFFKNIGSTCEKNIKNEYFTCENWSEIILLLNERETNELIEILKDDSSL